MRNFVIIFLFLTLCSCIHQKENVYINTGTDYGFNPPRWTIGCYYDSIDYQMIEKVINKFGKDYKLEKNEFENKYEWKNLIYPSFDKEPINLTLIRRLIYSENDIQEIESITIYIDKNDKDFLKPLKFRNRYKIKYFLNNLVE